MQDEMNAILNRAKDLKRRTADEISGNVLISSVYTLKQMVCTELMEKLIIFPDLKRQVQEKERENTKLKAANEGKQCEVLKAQSMILIQYTFCQIQ